MIHFNKVILHNFGSYQHAEIDLQNKGFCLVSGENHYLKDNALSNGAGKSFIWNGICFALTGLTIQGLKNNLKNIYNDESDAYVSLDFIVDKDHYFITRYIAPKSDLKIIKNEVDVSGKGIKESELKLTTLLPDLTQELIASTIIIGQAMPYKFSSFSPSGRKELLEKLTKSDFMIEDIKNRISNRLLVLNTLIRKDDDELLINNTKLNTNRETLEKLNSKITLMVKPDFDAEISKLSIKIKASETKIFALTEDKKLYDQKLEKINNDLLVLTNEKSNKLENSQKKHLTGLLESKTLKANIESQISNLNNDIKKLASNTGICPTCGQKLPGTEHLKQEKINKENELIPLQETLKNITFKLNQEIEINSQELANINQIFEEDLKVMNFDLQKTKIKVAELNSDILFEANSLAALKNQVLDFNYKKATWENEIKTINETINQLKTDITKLENTIKIIIDDKLDAEEHLKRVHQLDTLTKRDFRGFILSNIIKYLDTKAKDYSEVVFGHRDLNIYLDGNNLNITYCNKIFDGLSGGEKTRVDLIIQFAIRNLLISYLNFNSNILVLDEITDFLDITSCKAVMSLIEQELQTIESVFIISHHANDLELAIDTEIHVYKDNDGISTIIQN